MPGNITTIEDRAALVDSRRLARLLYIGDVPVESTMAGSALLYRLLQLCPPSNLRVVHGDLYGTLPSRRLPHVHYDIVRYRARRLLTTRLATWYGGRLFRYSPVRQWLLLHRLRAQQPTALITVAHGFMWLAAAGLAERLDIPLHLIVHDDVLATMPMPPSMKSHAEAAFAKVYCQAATRWCVSPWMAEWYEKQFGMPARVLYPSRAADGPEFDGLPARLGRMISRSNPMILGYAGSLATGAYARSLAELAAVVETNGGKLLIFSTLSAHARQAHGLNRPSVEFRPVVSSAQLIRILRNEVDVLFLPMSFLPQDRLNMQISFPSKLADYTAAGLPLLIRGPADCSAVRWASENPGIAEVVDVEDGLSLATAVERMYDGAHRTLLAEAAIKKGRQYFSHQSVATAFWNAVAPEVLPKGRA